MNAYGAARDYVERAEAGSRAAAHSVQVAIAVWNTSKLDVLKAIADEAKARETVGIYKDALSELGLAMYTGAANTDTDYLGNKEAELAQAELAGVAAAATATGLERARLDFARSIVNVGKARATVVVDWGKTLQARAAERAANAQVTLSRQDVSVAKLWATIPGAAPAQPVQALALYRGQVRPASLGCQRRRRPVRRRQLPCGRSGLGDQGGAGHGTAS